MIGAVVIGATGVKGRQAEGFVVGTHQQISARLAGRVRRIGRQRRTLGEETGITKAAVNLVGGYL